MLEVVAPLLHRKLKGIVPPLTIAAASPSEAPGQIVSVAMTMTDMEGGAVITVVPVAVQPLASVAVTLYAPAVRPLIVWLVLPLLQLKVKGAWPCKTFTVAVPSMAPQVVILVEDTLIFRAGAALTTVLPVAVQPAPSMTVTA